MVGDVVAVPVPGLDPALKPVPTSVPVHADPSAALSVPSDQQSSPSIQAAPQRPVQPTDELASVVERPQSVQREATSGLPMSVAKETTSEVTNTLVSTPVQSVTHAAAPALQLGVTLVTEASSKSDAKLVSDTLVRAGSLPVVNRNQVQSATSGQASAFGENEDDSKHPAKLVSPNALNATSSFESDAALRGVSAKSDRSVEELSSQTQPGHHKTPDLSWGNLTAATGVTTATDPKFLMSEPALKLLPHQARFDHPEVSSRVVQLVQSGGGEVRIDVTPPDESTFNITLSVQSGQEARLVVTGASDSTRTRLDQTTDQLRQQFAQMGLNLSLDFNQSSFNHSKWQEANMTSTMTASAQTLNGETTDVARADTTSTRLAPGASMINLYA